MKTTAVVESLSYYKTNVLFQRIPAYFKMIHVTFQHIEGTENILADCICCLRCMDLYVSLDPEGTEKDFGHDIF